MITRRLLSCQTTSSVLCLLWLDTFISIDFALRATKKHIKAAELLKFIPEDSFASIIEDTNVDYQVKKLYGRSMFYLLLYGLLQGDRVSLRSLEDLFNSYKFKILFNIDPKLEIKYNSISDRLANINVDFFKTLYELTYTEFSRFFDKESGLNYNIVSVDSTMVREAAQQLSEGMTMGNHTAKKTKQIKYTVSLTNFLPSSVEIFTDQAYLNENLSIPSVIENYICNSDDNVFVFDRGVNSRNKLDDIDNNNLNFVTRIQPGAKTKILESFKLEKDKIVGNLTVLSDQKVVLFNKQKNQSNPYRLIQTTNENNENLCFLTNLFEESIDNIIGIYKKRWDIEVFFRFIKQELNFKHFVSTNRNGIEAILYMTLITSMLILMYKKVNEFGYKTARRKLNYEIEDIYMKLVIRIIGGDPSLVFR